MRSFESLTERELLALTISLEEEDERVYADFAEGLRHDSAITKLEVRSSNALSGHPKGRFHSDSCLLTPVFSTSTLSMLALESA